VDWDTAKKVAGVARLLRRADALVRVWANGEGPRPRAAILIIFVLFWSARESGLYLSMHTAQGH
jgi:hypothetical protein